MKVKVQFLLETNEDNGVRLPPDFTYQPAGHDLRVSIKNHDSDEGVFVISVELEADSREQAEAVAGLEADQASSLLSWRFGLSVESVRHHTSQMTDKEGKNHYVMVADTIHVHDYLKISRSFNAEGGRLLSKFLSETKLSDEQSGILQMWRQILGETSKSMRFILLHRLRERLMREEDWLSWLERKLPEAVVLSSDRKSKGKKISVYTQLRNNVHPVKPKDFPTQEIEERLPEFQCLVKELVEEKFPELKF